MPIFISPANLPGLMIRINQSCAFLSLYRILKKDIVRNKNYLVPQYRKKASSLEFHSYHYLHHHRERVHQEDLQNTHYLHLHSSHMWIQLLGIVKGSFFRILHQNTVGILFLCSLGLPLYTTDIRGYGAIRALKETNPAEESVETGLYWE